VRHRSLGLLLLTTLLLATGAMAPARADTAYACRASTRTVPLRGATTRVASWLCAEGDPAGRPLVVTVAGTTYTHRYWDWEQDPARYSFARALAAAGYAVVTYDRTGTGASDLPPVQDVTIDAHTEVLHGLVQQLRRAGHPWVATAGHSQGSLVVMGEAAAYRDVDAIAITGMYHAPMNPLGAAVVAGSFAYPAQLDPRFAAVPPGYTTTIPGIRQAAFYGPTVDPAVVAHDEETKTVTAPLELATALPSLLSSLQIAAPVLTVIGQHDAAFCPIVTGCGDPLLPDPTDLEHEAWPAAIRFEQLVLKGSGHNVNLHPNAHVWFDAARRFFDEVRAAG
jgi:pimeloyl-ACP methyl ester carboxylesterase